MIWIALFIELRTDSLGVGRLFSVQNQEPSTEGNKVTRRAAGVIGDW
jgi:hypothetical protein